MSGPVLVTGAAGFAGSHLIDQLVADAVPVLAWHRPGGRPPRAMTGVTWHGVDMLDAAAVQTAIAGHRPSAVFHCAGAAHVGQSWKTTTHTLSVNVMGTHHLVEALRETAPDARLLVTSSGLVYGSADTAIDESHPLRPGNPYSVSKIAQELVASGSGGHTRSYLARPFNHIGPRQDASFVSAAFAKQIAEIETGRVAPEIFVGNLGAQRDLTDVRDTVRAYRLIVERGVPGRPYNICSGRTVAVQDVLNVLLSHARVAVRVITDPTRYRPNDTPIVLGDPTRARTELGWTPEIPFEQTAHDLLQYWRTRVGA